MSALGKLAWPYPVEVCANVDCVKPPFTQDDGAYVYRDLETDKLVVFCDDCAAYVEINGDHRFKLLAL